ncbi:hypothetical protein [Shimia sp.]|uniref:hypothetical protein n=1 Tax=Shimia sp. TaxID=1954381 RepID=UPI003BA8C533
MRLTLVGSEGHCVVDADGTIMSREGYDQIESFNLLHTSLPKDYGIEAFDDVDIIFFGWKMKDGTYEPPSDYEREGPNGVWETLPPRRLEGWV